MTAPRLRQSGCVAIDGRGLLIEGPPGSGKTTLALALIDRGAKLVGDDGVALEFRGGTLWAAPPPSTKGLIEIRNVGVASVPVLSAPIALVVTLDRGAPRFVEDAPRIAIGEAEIPHIALDPSIPQLALRAEYALAIHGLPLAMGQA